MEQINIQQKEPITAILKRYIQTLQEASERALIIGEADHRKEFIRENSRLPLQDINKALNEGTPCDLDLLEAEVRVDYLAGVIAGEVNSLEGLLGSLG